MKAAPGAPADWLVPDWDAPGIGALMTTRSGGGSAGPFDSMNLQSGGGDADDAVAQNRARLAAACGAAPVFLQQVHGTRVVRLTAADARPGAQVQVADASITTETGLACVIQVADCLPVLFAAPGARAVGAAHAGWRGLAAGVLERTVAALCTAAGCAPHELQAWLGASIGPRSFQVGADVLEAFGADPRATASRHFVADQHGKWLADLPQLARERLAAAGVTAVGGAGSGAGPTFQSSLSSSSGSSPGSSDSAEASGWCTVSDPSRFFSFRRERVTGRMGAAIWIERDG